MLQPQAPGNSASLLAVEAGLALIICALSFAWPRLGNRCFSRIEGIFTRFAQRQGQAVLAVGLSALLLRLAILPICPIPLPFSTDDFSFQLAADTFAHGRLTNPTPAMWTHLESIHITMQPSYMSMYFPGPGLVMAASKVLLGHFWFGILIMSALMCAAICWMLQAWLPPAWALLGGVLAVLRLGLFSYWINTYMGGSAISALGGALVLGALPRLMKTARFRYGLLMAVGIVLLALTRPYEGFLVCLPVAAALGYWLVRGKNRPRPAVLLRRAALPLALIVAAGAWMGYYDYRVFGNPMTLPYTIARNTYAVVPYYIWQSPHPTPSYRHEEMRRFYCGRETGSYTKLRTLSGFIHENLDKLENTLTFFVGLALLPPLFMLSRTFRDRRIRFLVLCLPVWCAGMVVGVYLFPHYLAPFTAAFYAIGLQSMRHLRFWKPEGRLAGKALVRLIVVLCILLAGLRLDAEPLGLNPPQWTIGAWICWWWGPGNFGVERARLETQLEKLPGKQLVLVRYDPRHEPNDEWVYNAADLDSSKVVWAREMDVANNRELMSYYANRKAWLVQPDLPSQPLSSYPARP